MNFVFPNRTSAIADYLKMVSILRLENFTSACTGGFQDPCWISCQDSFMITRIDNNLVSFGPRYSRLTTAKGTCYCDQYQITNAQFITQSGSKKSQGNPVMALGSSPDEDPYASVVVQGELESKDATVLWRGGGNAPFALTDTCGASYVFVSGEPPFGPQNYGFPQWWAAVIGGVLGLFFCCCLFSLCRRMFIRPRLKRENYSSDRGRRGADVAPVFVSEMTSDPGRQWDYNPQSSRQSSKNSACQIPVAIAVPVDERGRQIAMV